MAEVLLIKPSTGWYDSIKSHLDLPLGILSAATLIDQEYDVKFIDQQLEQNWKEKVKKELDKNPILVAVSAMTGGQILKALETAEFIRQESKDTKIVWGGPHPTIMPLQTIKDSRADIVVQGEGEETFYDLAKALEKDKPLKDVSGIWYKENGNVRFTGQRHYGDPDKFPMLPFHLVNIKDYMPSYFGLKTINLESSRGCPFRCTFCKNTVKETDYRRWRAWSPKTTIDYMKYVRDEFGVELVHFQDENFFVNLKRAKDIMEGIKTELNDMHWIVNGIRIDTIDLVNEDYLKLLVESNCLQIKIGVESGSQKILDLIKKDINIDQVYRANRKLAKFDTSPLYNFMCGFPYETKEDLQATINMMFKLKKDNPKAQTSAVNMYTPYPGTELYDDVLKMGFKEPITLEGWGNHSFESVEPIWLPKEHQKLVKSTFFLSLFLTGYESSYASSPIFLAAKKMYEPIAKFRMKNMFFKAMIEPKLSEMVLKNYQ